MGRSRYMAPEQIEGHEADARTDIFAFGAVVYEMVTGKKAFAASTQASLIAAILKDDPPLLSTVQPLRRRSSITSFVGVWRRIPTNDGKPRVT